MVNTKLAFGEYKLILSEAIVRLRTIARSLNLLMNGITLKRVKELWTKYAPRDENLTLWLI